MSGRVMRRLVDRQPMEAGDHFVAIDALDESGVPLKRGVYYYQIRSPGRSTTGRFLIVR